MSVYQYDPQLGYMPAIPEPFWVRRWFRWKPHCYACKITFKTRQEWDNHYVLNHMEASDSGRGTRGAGGGGADKI